MLYSAIVYPQAGHMIELSNIVFETEKVSALAESTFRDVKKVSKLDLITSNHPLLGVKFNKAPLSTETSFLFCGIVVDSIYIYQKSEKEFCTYLILRITKDGFSQLSDVLGYAENVSEEEYISRDFDFLFWQVKDFGMFVNRQHIGSPKGSYIIQIYNTKYEEIMDLRPATDDF